MKELEKLIMALYKSNHDLLRSPSPMKEPRYSLCRRLAGPQNRSGRRGKEKHLAPAQNPTPAVHPYARRDAMDTAVIRMECTPLHIYFSIDFSIQLLHLCLSAPTNLTFLQFRLYKENYLPMATGPQNGLQGKHLPIPT
jgi:hypothetical protein